jgi:hypothetical protein
LNLPAVPEVPRVLCLAQRSQQKSQVTLRGLAHGQAHACTATKPNTKFQAGKPVSSWKLLEISKENLERDPRIGSGKF